MLSLRPPVLSLLSLLVLPSASGCVGPSSDAEPGTGGAGAFGGAFGSGGTGALPNGSGGVLASGGVFGSGGAAASGGAVGSGGAGGTIAMDGSTGPIVNPNCPGDPADAYQGTPGAVPGRIEAENFDVAGYSDSTPGNTDGAYRTDVDVDIKPLGAGHAIGWMTAGEWLEYTVNVSAAGTYRIVLHAGAVEAGRTLAVSVCDDPLATATVPQIADWGAVSTVTTEAVHLDAGLQVIRVTVGAADYLDLDAITFEQAEGGTGGTGGAGGAGGAGGSGGTGAGGAGGALPKFVGNITTGWSGALDTNGRVFSTYWDQVTPENAGKWGSVQPTSSSPMNWSTLDAIYDYAMDKGIIFKQHTFVWGAQQPSGTLTQQQVRSWIQAFCQRYPETRLIDVVNEPPPHTTPSYANAIGGGTNTTWQWIINSFIWTREACPDAILILNDYNNVEWPDQNQHFIDIANAVKNAGAPIDAVGAQAHGLSSTISTQTMQNLIRKLHDDTGLPVYVTEYDIDLSNDAAQLTKYQEHMTFFLDQEWIHGITVWGWIYGQTWVPSSGLIRNGQPRPAMTWLMEELGRPAP